MSPFPGGGCIQKSLSRRYILTNPCLNEFSLGQACPSTNGIFNPTPPDGPFWSHPPCNRGYFSLTPPLLSLDCSGTDALPMDRHGFAEGFVSFRRLCGVQSWLVRFAPARAIVWGPPQSHAP